MRLPIISLLFLLMTVLPVSPADASDQKLPLDWKSVDLISIDGSPMAPTLFQGKVVMVVNTASFCGFTPQYEGLQKIWERYRQTNFVLLGVPSNDFGGQEPGTESEIKRFCEVNYAVDFPLTEKQKVIGADAHPLYRWALANTGAAGAPKWNFHKLLIGRDGRLVSWFPTRTEPEAPEVISAIEEALR